MGAYIYLQVGDDGWWEWALGCTHIVFFLTNHLWVMGRTCVHGSDRQYNVLLGPFQAAAWGMRELSRQATPAPAGARVS